MFVRASGGRAFHGVRARPFAQGRRRQLMRRAGHGREFVYMHSRVKIAGFLQRLCETMFGNSQVPDKSQNRPCGEVQTLIRDGKG